MRQLLLLSGLLLFLFACQTQPSESEDDTNDEKMINMLVGTYTKQEGHVDGKAAGIYEFVVAPNGHLNQQKVIADDIVNPSYLTLSPDQNLLFAVSEIGPDVDSVGYIHLYQKDENGEWAYVNKQSTHSFAPCYVEVHPSGKMVAVANYVGGTIALYPIKDGQLAAATSVIRLEGGSDHPRQDDSHPHATVFSPDGNYMFVPDLGANKIWSFMVDQESVMLRPTEQVSVDLASAAGPRHFVFHPNGKYAFVSNELDNTVTAFQVNNGFELEIMDSYSTLPTGVEMASYVADIHLTGDGEHLYVSNRGHNSIAQFSVNSADGSLTAKAFHDVQGDFPRNFVIHPDDKWLYAANQNSDQITIFEINDEGDLNFSIAVDVPTPVCLQFQSAK
jgi:6-phosphogluconolactonase